jgi:hypothetical protein
MTDHVVIQTRDALVARLKDQVASVGERVYLMHEVPPEEVSSDYTPFIVVRLGDDQDERAGMNNNGDVPDILEDIKLAIFVDCVTKMDGDAEQAAYNLRAEVETALFSTNAGITLDGTAFMLTRVAAANNRDDAPDQGAYNVVLQLEAWIRHLERSPTSFSY